MKPRIWVAVALAAGLLFPALALPDAVLADSMTIRLKERVLTLPELFHPDQTQHINPYYRPLFAVVHGVFDRCFGESHFGLRLLALLAHGFAGLAFLRLARTLGHGPAVRAVAVLWFLWTPGNVFNACWPVVAYWSLAAGLAFLSADGLVRFQASGQARRLAWFLAFAALSLLTSQTAYHLLALAAWMVLLPALPPERAGARGRAALAAALIAILSFVHFRWLEQVAQGMAGGSIGGRLAKLAQSYPGYFEGPFGSDHVVGVPGLAWGVALTLAVLLICGQRRHLFLAGYALLAPLPFAAINFEDRLAFHSSAVAVLFASGMFLEALPRVATRIHAPRLVQNAGIAAVAGLLMLLAFQSSQRFDSVHVAAQESEVLYDDLEALLPDLPAIERVAFVNWPRMLKWPLNDFRGVMRPEELIEPSTKTYFTTKDKFFTLGSADLSAVYDAVVAYEDGRLVRRTPDRPLGSRQPIGPLWYLAPDFRVIDRSDYPAGPRGAEAHRQAVLAASYDLDDPRRMAILEAPIPGISGLLADPSGLVEARLELPAPSGQAAVGSPTYFPGQIVADLDLDRPGLWVVITYLAAEDPVIRVAGALGRFCDWMVATIDGQEVPIHPVYYQCTGVLVPPGRHRVVVRQRPPGT